MVQTRRRSTTRSSRRAERGRRRRREQDSGILLADRLERIPLTEIYPYENNPRINEPAIESVANSIRTYGFLVPIVIDDSNVIVAGHTRFWAANNLEMNEVLCIRASHLSEEQIAQFRIIDNKVAELARWDFDALAGELGALASTGLDWTQFGFQQEELDCLTDVVADDCLASGAAAELASTERSRKGEKKANIQTRIVVGEFVFFVSSERYRQWAAAIRNECDYDDDAVDSRIKTLLGMDEYLD